MLATLAIAAYAAALALLLIHHHRTNAIMATILDTISAKKAADSVESAKKAAADAANAALATAHAATLAANASLKVVLKAAGPQFIQDTTGRIEVWAPTQNDPGFYIIRPVNAANTPVPPAAS